MVSRLKLSAISSATLLVCPNVILFSFDSGTTRYYALFEDFTPMGYDNNENPTTGLSYFTKGDISLKILMVTTQAFIS